MLKRWYSLLPPNWWSASSSGSRLSGDRLVWARDWTHLDELFFPPLLSRYSLLPPNWWSASSSGSRLSGDRLVWARDWTHLDEQCGMDCQPPPR
ncbi:hypothetical protein EMCRGX_G020066 [Ephydatia muelleri]